MEKSRNMYCLLFSFFVGGITLGSILGLGWKNSEIESNQEFIYVFLKNMPLFLAVNFWGREEYALCFGVFGLFLKGTFVGAAAVALLKSVPASCIGVILPKLLITVPGAVTLGCFNLKRRKKPCTRLTILAKISQSVLANFLVSCGEFGLYTLFIQNYR